MQPIHGTGTSNTAGRCTPMRGSSATTTPAPRASPSPSWPIRRHAWPVRCTASGCAGTTWWRLCAGNIPAQSPLRGAVYRPVLHTLRVYLTVHPRPTTRRVSGGGTATSGSRRTGTTSALRAFRYANAAIPLRSFGVIVRARRGAASRRMLWLLPVVCPSTSPIPNSPWQRGTNENTSGLLHQYFPKDTDLSFRGPGILDNVAAELNNRPRKHPRIPQARRKTQRNPTLTPDRSCCKRPPEFTDDTLRRADGERGVFGDPLRELQRRFQCLSVIGHDVNEPEIRADGSRAKVL